jgi:hypothetical protein
MRNMSVAPSAAAFETRCIVSLRAASGMVSRGLVTTSITAFKALAGRRSLAGGSRLSHF